MRYYLGLLKIMAADLVLGLVIAYILKVHPLLGFCAADILLNQLYTAETLRQKEKEVMNLFHEALKHEGIDPKDL